MNTQCGSETSILDAHPDRRAPDRGSGLRAAFRRARANVSLRRDSDVMGLTVSLTLLVALSAGSDTEPHSKLDVLLVVWGTTVGIAVSYWFALLVSTWLTPDAEPGRSPLELLVAQTTAAVLVAVSATIPVLLLSVRFDRLGARLVAALSMGALVAIETRRGNWPLRRRLILCGGVVVVGVVIATLKWWIGR